MRQHIRGAIREYQTQLIQRVKDDIESLHEKFKVRLLFDRSAYNLNNLLIHKTLYKTRVSMQTLDGGQIDQNVFSNS